MPTGRRPPAIDALHRGGSTPPVRCHFYDEQAPADSRDPRLAMPLPVGRRGIPATGPDAGNITYGDAFRVVRRLLTGDRCARLLQAAAHRTGGSLSLSRIREVRVRSEKHGAFYHPFRVELVLADAVLPLAANLAVSEAGRSRIEDEFRLLRRMRRRFASDRIPAVFAFERVRLDGRRRLPAFLAEWFEDHHEFHLHRDPADGRIRPALWHGSDRNPVFLSDRQAHDAYRGVAVLLTGFYDPATTERVAPWHHAAGDFVLRVLDENRVDVRLITLRGYRPMTAEPPPDPETVVDALVVFLVDLSVRNRIDRLEGTGEIVWSEETVVDATVTGFADALAAGRTGFPPETAPAFLGHVAGYSPDAMGDIFDAVVSRLADGPGGTAAVRRGRGAHIERLLSAVAAHAAGRREPPPGNGS